MPSLLPDWRVSRVTSHLGACARAYAHTMHVHVHVHVVHVVHVHVSVRALHVHSCASYPSICFMCMCMCIHAHAHAHGHGHVLRAHHRSVGSVGAHPATISAVPPNEMMCWASTSIAESEISSAVASLRR